MMTSGASSDIWTLGQCAKLMASLHCDFSTSIITWTMENNYLGASNFPHMGVKWGGLSIRLSYVFLQSLSFGVKWVEIKRFDNITIELCLLT